MASPSHPHMGRKLCIVAIACLFSVSSSFANSLSYTAPTREEAGRFSGQLPIAKIGVVRTPRGLVRFHDDELTVLAVPQWLFDRNVVLRGAIVQSELIAGKSLSGLVVFLEGEWQSNFVSPGAVDQLDTTGGEHLRGKITARDGRSFLFQTSEGPIRKIAFADISKILSQKAFTFNMPVTSVKLSTGDTGISFESASIALVPTKEMHSLFASKIGRLPNSHLPGTEPGISKKALITYLALDVAIELAPAIAIPLVLNPKTQAAANNRIRQYDAQHGIYDGSH